jgi:hypothetical protein
LTEAQRRFGDRQLDHWLARCFRKVLVRNSLTTWQSPWSGYAYRPRLPHDEKLTDEIVAVKIVEVVKDGLRDSGEIYERVFNDLQLRK